MATKKDKSEAQTEEVFDKRKALETAINEINKKLKTNAVMKMGSIGKLDIDAVSTGILPLDIALGIGGLPRGRIVEIYGAESSGKTTVTLHIIASVQKHGGTAAFIDAEHALDPVYAKRLGVDIDELVISQPDNGEQGLEIADSLIRSGAVDVIVIDSVAALVPKTEIDGDMGAASVGVHARMMSQAMRKLAAFIDKTNTIAIFINQLREKVGIMYGNPETTTGGRALKFYSSVRLEVRKGESIKEGGEVIGNQVKIKVAKNKVAPPFKVATFDLIYGEGYSRVSGIINVSVDLGIIRQAGAYFYYNDERIRGKDAFQKYLTDNPEIADEIEKQVLDKLIGNDVAVESVTPVEYETPIDELYGDDE